MNINYGLITISGSDAGKFLQGQVTCNVLEIAEQHSSLGAHCDPKGRVLSLFYLFKQRENYYLCLPQNLIDLTLTSLKKYAVFSKVTLEDVSNNWQMLEITDPHLQKLLTEHQLLQDIIAGIPTIYPETSGLFTPHEINLPALGGVSFTKGCYTGQEIIARMHYLGKLKKRMYRVHVNHETPPMPGTPVTNQQSVEVGNIVAAAADPAGGCQALAVLLNSAAEQPLFIDQVVLKVLDLPYVCETHAIPPSSS